MRIITGKARGVNLKSPEGLETRPTTEFAKEGIFSAIQFDLEGRTVLDLFAGSGQMGLEALSRGAEKAVFVDSSRDAFEIIVENCKKTKLYAESKVVCADYMHYIKSQRNKRHFDIVFVDPPYSKGLLCSALYALYESKIVDETSMIICEDGLPNLTGREPNLLNKFDLKKEYKYGKVHFFILIPKKVLTNV